MFRPYIPVRQLGYKVRVKEYLNLWKRNGVVFFLSIMTSIFIIYALQILTPVKLLYILLMIIRK